MAKIRPFRAVRPANGLESEIASLPYDVYNRKEAKLLVSKNPKTFLKIDRAESQFDDSVSTYDERVYKKAREMYVDMLDRKEFVKDEKPCFYLYEQVMDGRSQTGLVCAASVLDYQNNIIKKHENTRADKELDRINHVNAVDAQTGPIFLSYRKNEALNDLFKRIKEEKPYTDFVGPQDVVQRCWIIDKDEDIEFIIKTFDEIDSLYIADGHHRCASAAKVSLMRRENAESVDEDAEYNFFLSVIFSDSDLMIMDYNRVIKNLNGYSKEEFIKAVSEKFEVNKRELNEDKPSKKGDIFMIFKDEEYVISLKKEYLSDDPIKTLDVSVLQDYVLMPILGIEDPKTDNRIDFVGGIRGVKELIKRNNEDGVVCFAMYPTSMKELFNVADAGLLMPPKSTWFEPKLLSGLFIHELS